jgi:hypothetical protein
LTNLENYDEYLYIIVNTNMFKIPRSLIIVSVVFCFTFQSNCIEKHGFIKPVEPEYFVETFDINGTSIKKTPIDNHIDNRHKQSLTEDLRNFIQNLMKEGVFIVYLRYGVDRFFTSSPKGYIFEGKFSKEEILQKEKSLDNKFSQFKSQGRCSCQAIIFIYRHAGCVNEVGLCEMCEGNFDQDGKFIFF